MGTTVQEANQKIYTDVTGVFSEGMKKEDAEGKLFNIFEKQFAKIDKNPDGKLSEDEITSELQRNIVSHRTAEKWFTGAGILTGLYGLLTHKLVPQKSANRTYGLALLLTSFAIYNRLNGNKLEQRIARGCN